MKLSSTLLSAILGAIGLISACGQDSKPSHVDAADSSARPADTTFETKTKHAVDAAESATKDAVAKAKEEWKKLTDPKVVDTDKEIAQLKEELAKTSGEAKVELDKLVKEIDAQRRSIDEDLHDFKSTSAEKWQAASQEIDRALAELKKTIDRALEKSK